MNETLLSLRRAIGVALACGIVSAAAAEPLQLQRRFESPAAVAKRTSDAKALLLALHPELTAGALQPAGSRGRVEQFRQTVAGIEVYGARLTVLRDAQRQPRTAGGSYSDKAATAALPAFALDARAAVQQALDGLGIDAIASAAKADGNGYQRITLQSTAEFRALRPARAKPVWYPANDRLIAAYSAEVVFQRRGDARPTAFALVISAEDGRVLRRNSQIHDLEPFSYRVFAGTDGFPYVDPYGYTNPHPTGVADGWRPVVPAPMNLVTLGDAGTGDPWLADDATQTRGNNVDAFFAAETLVDGECYGDEQMEFDAEVGDFRAQTNGPRRFDYAYDATTTLTDYQQCLDPSVPIPTGDPELNAKIVQGFYAGNWLHDYFHGLGYDESAGNSQADNYGRGGIAGDPLIVLAAQFSTYTYAPADGESPVLTLGFNPQTRTRRDVSGFDLGVTAHEWAHTMFGRLTVSGYHGQPGAINEGTADFVGLMVTVREQDRHAMPGEPDFSAAYAVGAYMNLDYDFRADDLPAAGSPGYPDNSYYHGIRRYPYSSDFRRNPLTFRHISLDHPVPAGSAPFDWKARSLLNAEIHTAGEIWTTALWQCARNVLAAAPSPQFETRKRDFLGWLVSGLKLFPTDATYTEARTAVLAAIRADSEADYRRCRSGFAERGMGAGALSPPRDSFSLRGGVESFRDLERALSVVSVHLREIGGDADGVLDRGESGEVVVTLRNSGFSALDRITLAVPPIPGLFDLPDRVYLENIALAPEETREFALPFRVRTHRDAITLPVQVFAWDNAHPEAFALTSRAFAVNYDLVRDRHVDSAAHAATFRHDWIRGFEDYPHGCALYICTYAEGDRLADVLDWQRQRYDGRWSYVMGDAQLAANTWLATQPFTVSATAPLELQLQHHYDFERATTVPGYGRIEIRVDDGPWQSVQPLLVAGNGHYGGVSGGWRDETLRFNASIAGRRVQLRLRMNVAGTFRANDMHWAIARTEIRGATQAMFSRVTGD
ncbi:MAG TPA: M36 family metallopeptidase [Tahibacter sp.]|uniref:M36 family metallopeptidase n=1 Tax=Tahibacter sp. TaxID=2056211 RepID=UPI002CE86264|nr:M36 family metallopeptidase [Tahibacter sp.]HSX62690.1 M36 family metallopeptidase [Tahibacter sp.]